MHKSMHTYVRTNQIEASVCLSWLIFQTADLFIYIIMFLVVIGDIEEHLWLVNII